MSVIIDGMDIPPNCHECLLNQGEYGADYYEKCRCMITGHSMSKQDYKKRQKTCPMHESN